MSQYFLTTGLLYNPGSDEAVLYKLGEDNFIQAISLVSNCRAPIADVRKLRLDGHKWVVCQCSIQLVA